MDDGWVTAPLLKPLPAPLPAWIVAPGALRLAVSTPPGLPYDWYGAVAVAWARSPATGVWAVLLADQALRRIGGAEPVLSPRCGWFRYAADQVSVIEPVAASNPWGQAWHGESPDGPTQAAIDVAVASLPVELQDAARTPAGSGFDVDAVPELRGLRKALDG